MRLAIDVQMHYRIGPLRTAMLAIEAARYDDQAILTDRLEIDGGASLHRIAGESGIGTRIWARLPAQQLPLRYRAEVDVARAYVPLEGRAAAPMHALPAEALTYIRPSRFCQSDQFTAFVANRFGDFEGGAKIGAIRDWIAEEVAYLHATSDAQTTVVDTFARREGVCRDFAHLVCALSRAANIPARYASVYGLGVAPPDFHAVAQVWLDGGWHFVDATRMCAPDEIVMIGVGRDAFDAPFMETEDDATLVSQSVSVTRVSDRDAL